MVDQTGILGAFCQFVLGKNSKAQSSLNFLQSGPRKFTKSDFFGIGPDLAGSERLSFLLHPDLAFLALKPPKNARIFSLC